MQPTGYYVNGIEVDKITQTLWRAHLTFTSNRRLAGAERRSAREALLNRVAFHAARISTLQLHARVKFFRVTTTRNVRITIKALCDFSRSLIDVTSACKSFRAARHEP